jgi:hypothetical protein
MKEVIIIASKMKIEDKWQFSAFTDIKKVAKFEPWNNNPQMDVKIFKVELPLEM